MQHPDNVEEVGLALKQAKEFIESHHLCIAATIEDYPIGRKLRGRCRIEVAYKKKGFRACKTTTDKHDNWCKPKYGTYEDDPILVVDDLKADDGRSVAWLHAGFAGWHGGFRLQWPNDEWRSIALPPCVSAPRREDKPVTIHTKVYDLVGGPAREETTHYVEKADAPELCDAWDAWVEGYRPLREYLMGICRAAGLSI